MNVESLDFSLVRAVTFDVAGTLLRPYPGVGEIYSATLARHGVALAPNCIAHRFHEIFEELHAYTRPVVNEAGERAFWREVVRASVSPECPPELFETVFDELWKDFASARCWQPLPGAAETLEKLHARGGLKLAVLSNWDARLHHVLAELDWTRFFQRVFVSSEIGAEKPDVWAFRAVEEALELPAAALLHAGDSLGHDYRAALAAGWQAVLVAPRSQDSAIQHVDRLAQLADALA